MKNKTISSMFETAERPLLSFEFFPPKTEAGMEKLRANAERMREAAPDFVTVTYGAGGSTRDRTMQVCRLLDELGYPVIMPHLTCVGASRDEIREQVSEWYQIGFRNIMALRGDPPQGAAHFEPAPDGPAHASDLVELIQAVHPEICCGVAGYPEKHPEAAGLAEDIGHLQTKLAAGGSFITTQLFFDNRAYFDFVERCREQGIQAPVLPGILPAISLKQVRRMLDMCGASLPAQLEVNLEDAGDSAEAASAVGIQWAVRQIEELIAGGAPGIHLYVLNRADVAMAPVVARCFAQWR